MLYSTANLRDELKTLATLNGTEYTDYKEELKEDYTELKDNIERLKEEWYEMLQRGTIPLFELEIVDLSTDENDYLLVNITMSKLGVLSCDFNLDFPFEMDVTQTLDWHLEGLHEAITQDSNFQDQYSQGHKEEEEKADEN